MKLEFKNGNVVSFEGNVDEYLKVRDIINPEWIDVADIPLLGDTMPERVENYIKYRKEGFVLTQNKE